MINCAIYHSIDAQGAVIFFLEYILTHPCYSFFSLCSESPVDSNKSDEGDAQDEQDLEGKQKKNSCSTMNDSYSHLLDCYL